LENKTPEHPTLSVVSWISPERTNHRGRYWDAGAKTALGREKEVWMEKRVGPVSKGLFYLRRAVIRMYYRYTVEVGISTLENWEAAIVNSVFLILAVSIAKQTGKLTIFLLALAKR
jgi:hypothetical protein